MRIVADRCTLVIVGAWNQAIFTPQFVAQRIMPGPEAVHSEIEVGAGGFTASHAGSHFRLSVRPDRLIWTPLNTDEGTLKSLEDAAHGLLTLLGVTPISAVGVNYGFDVSASEGEAARMLELPDSDKLEQLGMTPESVSVRRKLRVDSQVVNIVVQQTGDAPITVDLNFHRDVDGAKTAMEGLSGAMVSFKKRALEILRSLYHLELD